jgi:hypothetical protein
MNLVSQATTNYKGEWNPRPLKGGRGIGRSAVSFKNSGSVFNAFYAIVQIVKFFDTSFSSSQGVIRSSYDLLCTERIFARSQHAERDHQTSTDL